MKKITPDTINAIMTALDEGVAVAELVRQFPGARTVIAEIAETRRFLDAARTAIPVPVTAADFSRLPTTEGPVESPYINKLLSPMNYKIVVPVLVLGLVAISGAVFISGQKPSELTQTTDTSEAPTTNEEGTAQTPDEVIAANPGVETPSVPTKTPTTPNPVAVGSTIDDILAGFSAATQSEQQVALADDGVTEDMFAQAELSGFETDTYDF